jgi:hypothetical protein
MIISHKHKFIFIKTGKTAGTSIEVFLSQQCGPEDILTPIFPAVERHQPRNYEGFVSAFHELRKQDGLLSALSHPFTKRKKFYRHMPAWVVQTRLPAKIWNSYFKFCVERNPWDKVLSHYHMLKSRQGGSLSLDQYLANGKFPINYVRYTDPAGAKIIVDRVLRYENLIDDLTDVFSRLNVHFDGSLGVKAKSEYRTDRTPYQLVFSPEQRRIVEQAFAREIELHGYRFEANPSHDR